MSHVSRPTIVGISGNLVRPSRTRVLVSGVLSEIERRGIGAVQLFDVLDAGPKLGVALARDAAAGEVDRVLSAIESADALVVASPVYKASYTGLFKHIFDLVEPQALEGIPVIVGATGGSERHALAIEHQLRPLFAFFSAQTLPLGLYASGADFAAPDCLAPQLQARIGQAVDQLQAALGAAARHAPRRLEAAAS
jgi:FMN reductase